MFGVILWSDPASGQAVIWCEESGNLAYYQAPGCCEHMRHGFFDAGDYVEFEVTKDDRLSRASNAQRVYTQSTPRLQETLQRGSELDDAQRRGRPIGQLATTSDHAAAEQARVGGRFSHPG